jgi:hypothetical protein
MAAWDGVYDKVIQELTNMEALVTANIIMMPAGRGFGKKEEEQIGIPGWKGQVPCIFTATCFTLLF